MGTLYIVATPIGNLDDITLRAIDTLKTVDVIACEDTRHSLKLLESFGIKKKLVALHAHNESNKSHMIIEQLQQGLNVALISDAGTPLISDPGFPLVKKARQQNIPVIPIPGPCALIAALSASGISCQHFTFEGFLPAKLQALNTHLTKLKEETRTLVVYESTHRIKTLLKQISTIMPDRKLVLAKEITKSHESIVTGSATMLLEWLSEDEKRVKGEFVLCIEGYEAPDTQTYQVTLRHVLDTLKNVLSNKDAAKIAAEITGCKKNEAYRMLV